MDIGAFFEKCWDDIRNWFDRFFSSPQPPVSPPTEKEQGLTFAPPTVRRVCVLIYDPKVPEEGGKRLTEIFNWSNPLGLITGYIADLQFTSFGYAQYEVIQQKVLDYLPVKQDGFQYTPASFVNCMRANSGFHSPDAVDYRIILSDPDLVQDINAGIIHEVWLFGPPYAGFYESRMVGPGAFFCNAPALDLPGFSRRFVVMGFNYERGVGEMLEAFGHRAEATLSRVFSDTSGAQNLWERFTRIEKDHPGQAEVGTVHFAPNSTRDYEWNNPTPVLSRCNNWYKYPDLSGDPREVNALEWGSGNIQKHHIWWLRHLPHYLGEANGKPHNWWLPIVDPNTIS